MTRLLKIMCILLLSAFLSCSKGVTLKEDVKTPPKRDYNILLVSFDAMRARNMSCYGYQKPTTPNLDKLAKQGILFKQAISPASWTLPATMAVFTGLYPSRHQVLNKYTIVGASSFEPTVLSKDIKTLPEILKEHGYMLVGFTGDAGVSGKFGYSRGFETYLDDKRFAGMDYSIPPDIEWLRKNKDRKFFMFLHGYDSHGQYDPPDNYTRIFDKDYNGALKGGKDEQGKFREDGLEHIVKGEPPPHINMTGRDAQFYTALYDEKIRDADERFAGFMKEFEKMGLREKTIIVLFADHGEEFFEHGYLDHGPTLYEEQLHVPMIVLLPWEKSGKVIEDQVRTLDIMPTVMDLLGIPIKHRVDGVSLAPLIKGDKMQPIVAYSETDYRLVTYKRSIRIPLEIKGPFTALDGVDRSYLAGYKLIYTLESDEKELYDLKTDPMEKVNLADKEKRIAYELEQFLFQWIKSTGSDYRQYKGRNIGIIKEY